MNPIDYLTIAIYLCIAFLSFLDALGFEPLSEATKKRRESSRWLRVSPAAPGLFFLGSAAMIPTDPGGTPSWMPYLGVAIITIGCIPALMAQAAGCTSPRQDRRAAARGTENA